MKYGWFQYAFLSILLSFIALVVFVVRTAWQHEHRREKMDITHVQETRYRANFAEER